MMIETWKITAFDGLELVRSKDLQQDAPRHFHEGYAIGISLKGLQTIILQRQTCIIPPSSIIFLNPREVHAHKAFEHIAWSHRMLYISPEYISWLQKSSQIRVKGNLCFTVPLTVQPVFYKLFNTVHQKCIAQVKHPNLVKEFEYCMAVLFNHYSSGKPLHKAFTLEERIKEIQDYIEYHHQDNLNLERLSQKFHLSKYHLIRSFKEYKGVTPNEYLNILRIEKAKNYILQGNSLVSSALEAGFYDQSHFSHYFTRYTSFTPGQFQRGCIELQLG